MNQNGIHTQKGKTQSEFAQNPIESWRIKAKNEIGADRIDNILIHLSRNGS